MRITQSMMTNRLLINVQRNMSYLDKIQQQIASTKRIQMPSDDPILAARALKFRTSVSETQQYQRNVAQGLSWMSGTDKAFKNVTDIMTKMRELLDQGTSGENVLEDRVAIATQIEQLMNQLGKEMNATYAGRYLFSGYRTNQPPVFEKANDFSYNINQYFTSRDVELTRALHKLQDPAYGNTNESAPYDIKIIKLAYTGTTAPTVTIGDATYNVTAKTLNDADAYTPAAGAINFIAETGELVLGDGAYKAIQTAGMTVNYDKTGFVENELNPMVYFDCTDLSTLTAGFYAGLVTMTENLPVNIAKYGTSSIDLSLNVGDIDASKPITVTIGGVDYPVTVNSGVPGDNDIFYNSTTGEMSLGANVTSLLGNPPQNVTVNYTDTSNVTKSGATGVNLIATTLSYGAVVTDPAASPTLTITNKDGSKITVPSNGTPAYTLTFQASPLAPGANEVCIDQATGEIAFGANLLGNAANISVTYTVPGSSVTASSLLSNPDITNIKGTDIKSYSMDGQQLEYEFGVNTRITVNTLGKDVYTDKLYADLQSFISFVKSVTISDEDQLTNKFKTLHPDKSDSEIATMVNDQITRENQEAQSALYDRFNNMLGLVDRHFTTVSTMQTEMGTRMNRLQLIEKRLEGDLINYKDLLSQNEDTNMVEAGIELSVATAAYNASLSAGAKIIQLTLADYIR